MILTRFFKELFNPSLKCKRLGHDMKTIVILIREEGGGFRNVVSDFNAKKDYCKRCGGEHSEPRDLEYVTGYTKCKMPSNMWDEIREKGYTQLHPR